MEARTDWLVLSRLERPARSRLHLARRRLPIAGAHAVVERKGGRWHCETRQPEDCAQFRRLLLDPTEQDCKVTTRPRFGTRWAGTGSALRIINTGADYKLRPALINEGWDCSDLSTAHPDFAAITARKLVPGLKNRVTIEFRCEPSARPHVCQFGVARLESDPPEDSSGKEPPKQLTAASKLISAVLATSAGEVLLIGEAIQDSSAEAELSIVDPGVGLRQRSVDWCSGGPPWLNAAGTLASRVTLEADLDLGVFRVTVDSSQGPVTAAIKVPALLSQDAAGWRPIVSLTAVGQQARILDVQAEAVV